MKKILFVASTLILSSCVDVDPNEPLTQNTPDASAVAFSEVPPQGTPRRSVDAQFWSIASQVDGFGGFFLTPAGELNFYLTDLSLTTAAREAIGKTLSRHRPDLDIPPSHMRAIQGEYDFRELLVWRRQIEVNRGSTFITAAGVDERLNRVSISVADESQVSRLLDLARGLGIPAEAVEVDVEGPEPVRASLTDSVRPVSGGYQIDSNGVGACSLGFNAEAPSFGNGMYFVTASHCTYKFGALTEGERFGQPTDASHHFIASEVQDPATFSCPEGSGYPCRHSDAALLEYDDPSDAHFGRIARAQVGSPTLDPTGPPFVIVGKVYTPYAGENLTKVGSTTGRSAGLVTETCKNTLMEELIYLICQDRVDTESQKGDSGGPVFRIASDTDVYLYGILWGGGSTYSLFSSLGMIEIEDFLGNGDLVTH